MARHTQPTGTQKRSGNRSGTGKVQAVVTPPNEPRRGPSHDEIARRAYELFLARGGAPGHADEDWMQAERELRLGRY